MNLVAGWWHHSILTCKSRPTGIVLPTLKHPPLPGAIVLPRRTDTSSCVALMYSDVMSGRESGESGSAGLLQTLNDSSPVSE